jgi:hypothetical protein
VTGLFFAWAAGEGIIFYRWARLGAPPIPGVLAMSSVLFLGLAVIGEYRPARPVVTAFAFAVDLAILLQVVGKAPTGVTGWPPAMITDPGAILPNGASSSSSSSSSSTSGTAGQNALTPNPGTLRPAPGLPGVVELPG